MNSRKVTPSHHEHLTDSVGAIFLNTVGNLWWKFIPQQAANDPISVMFFGSIGAFTLLISSPLWAPVVGIYAGAKRRLNTQELSKLQIEWQREESEMLATDAVVRTTRLKSMPRAPRSSFSEESKLTTKSDLEKLPKDLAKIIGGLLDQQSLAKLVHASKSTHTLFNESRKASALLNFVRDSSYDKADDLLRLTNLNLQLMLKRQVLENADGSVDYLSPLELAVRQFDLQMWQLFKSEIKNTGNEDLLSSFNKQTLMFKGNYIDISRLFDAYTSFQKLYAEWLRCDSVTVERLSESLLHLASLQRDLLPRHIWNVFASKNINWEVGGNFVPTEQGSVVALRQFTISSNIGNNDICARGNHVFDGMIFTGATVKGLCFDQSNSQSTEVNRTRLTHLASALQYDAEVLSKLIANTSENFTDELDSHMQHSNVFASQATQLNVKW